MVVSEGVYASLLTPRHAGAQDINLGSMWELIDFVGSRAVDGLVLLGIAGEFVHFSPAERMRLMSLAPRRSRVPMIINVSHSTIDGSVELAQAASSSGAVAVLLTPPAFYRYDDDTVRTYFENVVEAAGIPIPVLLYHTPQCIAGCSFELAADLLKRGIVHGIVDSGRDPSFLETLHSLRKELPFTLMTGDHHLVHGQSHSATVSGVACAVPELVTALRRSSRLMPRAAEYLSWADRLPIPFAIRESLALRGLKPGNHAVSLSPTQAHVVAAFREWFHHWLPATLEECRHA